MRPPSPWTTPTSAATLAVLTAALVAVLVLLSWLVGAPEVLTFGPRWAPMAPSTAAVVLAFALTIGLSGRPACSS